MRRTTSGLAVAVLLAAVVAAQEQVPDQAPTVAPVDGVAFSDEVEVTLVNLEVRVTDGDGNPVTDLQPGDFRVLQNRLERQVTNFELFTEERIRSRLEQAAVAPQGEPAPTGEAEAEIRPTYLVLYVDNDNLRPLDRNRVLRQMRDFLEGTVKPPLQMMVVTYQKSLKVLLPFTDDQRVVLDSLRGVRTTTAGLTEREATRRDILAQIRRLADQEHGSSASSPAALDQANTVQRLILGFAREEYSDTLFAVEALRNVVTSLAGLPGRKALLYVSNGLPMVAGVELFYEYAEVYKDYSILTSLAQFDRGRLLEGLAASANAQGVTFYAVSAAGLEVRGMGVTEQRPGQSPLAATVASRNLTDSLNLLARETGGLAIVHTNDVSLGLERVRRDLFTYYSIGYPLSSSGTDKVHSIEVSLPNHPGYEVRHQRRLVEKSVETRVQDTVVTGLVLGVADNPMGLELTTGAPVPAGGDRWMVPIHVSFPLERVTLVPEGEDRVARVTLFVAARGDDGRQSDMVRQNHEIRVTATAAEAPGGRWGLDLSLLMETGSFRVTVGLLDQLTRQPSYQTTRVVVGER